MAHNSLAANLLRFGILSLTMFILLRSACAARNNAIDKSMWADFFLFRCLVLAGMLACWHSFIIGRRTIKNTNAEMKQYIKRMDKGID